jgi:hypothetical protein
MSVSRSIAVLLVASAAACAPDRLTRTDAPTPSAPSLAKGGGSGSSSSEPHFLEPETGAPTISNPVVQFWAKKGVDTRAEMTYHRAHGGRDSIPFFTIRIRPRSLWKRPDGSLIANGDSVRITLTLVDAQRLIVDCQPSGLLFTPSDPARLKLSFAETDDDVNGDGRVNATDAAITRTFAVWRQETATAPWLRTTSTVAIGTHEVETTIGGFTGYAIAW